MPSDDDSDLIIGIKIFLKRKLCRIILQTSRSMTNNLQWKSIDKSQKALYLHTNWRRRNEDGQNYKNHQVQKTEEIFV